MPSKLMMGKPKSHSEVLALAAKLGADHTSGKRDKEVDKPRPKSVTIEETANGYKVRMGDGYPPTEMHHKDWRGAVQYCGAYMNGMPKDGEKIKPAGTMKPGNPLE